MAIGGPPKRAASADGHQAVVAVIRNADGYRDCGDRGHDGNGASRAQRSRSRVSSSMTRAATVALDEATLAAGGLAENGSGSGESVEVAHGAGGGLVERPRSSSVIRSWANFMADGLQAADHHAARSVSRSRTSCGRLAKQPVVELEEELLRQAAQGGVELRSRASTTARRRRGQPYLVLGHESLGEVVAIGDTVSRLAPGDLVDHGAAAEPASGLR